jgi:CHAT domain-containing protein
LTRPLDRHLEGDELDALVTLQAPGAKGANVAGRLTDEAIREAQRHVESCLDCDQKIQMHKSVQNAISGRNSGNSVKGPNCSGERDWVSVAAGLVGELEASERMKHAARCEHCGPLLKAAAKSLSDEISHDDEFILANLSSARLDWQKQMAQTLRSSDDGWQRRGSDGSFWRTLFCWPRPLVVAAGFALLFVVGWISVQRLRPSSAEQLLAQAYTERRTIEVRIPGADYAPLHIERSGTVSNFDKPEPLLKAEALISEKLKQHPNDAEWLQAKARADLLDGRYDDAIKTLQRALASTPESAELLSDLGSAFFLRAKSADRPIDFGNAIESLGRALTKNPDDRIALFNRALACEEMFLYVQAIDDWQHYLRIDPQGGWAEEAKIRLTAVRNKVEKRSRSRSEPLTSPFEVTGHRDDAAVEKIDRRVEEYQDLALCDWLPGAVMADTVRNGGVFRKNRGLQVLSTLMIDRHNDPWLTDLLSGHDAKEFPSGVKNLAEAVRANEKADAASAHSYAVHAASLFKRANNVAGLMRANVEEISALNGNGGHGCDRAVRSLDDAFRKQPYSWLRARFEFEAATCAWLREDVGTARVRYAAASEEAKAHGFQAMYLRSQDHLAGLEAVIGGFESAWKRTAWGLAGFWSGNYPDVRGYNLYFNLYELTRLTGEAHTQVAVWLDGIRLTDSSPDIAQRAMAHLAMGNAAEKAGMPELSVAEFSQADELFKEAPQIPSTRIARLEAETRLAAVETGQGHPQHAVSRLRPLQPEIEKLADNYLAVLFYSTLGQAESLQAEWADAEKDLQESVRLAEMQMRNLADAKSRFQVAHESSGAYRALVQRELLTGDPVGALSLWERYKGAALRDSANVNLLSYLPELTNQTVVSYAILPRGVAIWVMDDRGIFSHWEEGRSAEIVSSAARLRDLCANPDSDPSELRRNERLLYDTLILPIRDRLVGSRVLIAELDEGLDGLAVEVLADEHGRYFGDVAPVGTSLGIYYRDESRSADSISRNTPALIVGVPSANTELGLELSPLPDVIEEIDSVSRTFATAAVLKAEQATRESILEHLQGVKIFHFAGHAFTGPEQTGVVAADGLITAGSFPEILVSQLQLAVFSACETGNFLDGTMGQRESLVRAFLQAGVPNVVASRWRVDSTATRKFMELFYRALLGGSSVTASIRLAEAQLRSQNATSHPYYWAAFGAFGSD